MICQHSDCPPASEIDIPAMHARYLRERDRRVAVAQGVARCHTGVGDG